MTITPHLLIIKSSREVLYWPRINQDNSQTTASWLLCCTHRPKEQAEPPMTRDSVLDCDGKSHQLLLKLPRSRRAAVDFQQGVISCPTTVLARRGVPCELFSDNGPQFSAVAGEWGGFKTPTYPKSNGVVESPVKAVKLTYVPKMVMGWRIPSNQWTGTRRHPKAPNKIRRVKQEQKEKQKQLQEWRAKWD